MPPFALTHIVLALIMSAGTLSTTENEAKTTSAPPQQIISTKGNTPAQMMHNKKPEEPGTSSDASSAVPSNPVKKAAIEKVSDIQTEQNSQQRFKNISASLKSRSAVDNPGQYFPETEVGDNGGYSAPLGLKDESHNDWMK